MKGRSLSRNTLTEANTATKVRIGVLTIASTAETSPTYLWPGRDISVSHDGLGAVRVMRTCGMMGEVVGMAAAVCKARQCTPREVYQQHLNELKALMQAGVGVGRKSIHIP